MTIKHLDHLNLTVNNLAESVAWYARVLGFELVEQGVKPDYGPWGIIRSGDAMLCLYQRANRAPSDTRAYEESDVHRINHVGFRITDRQAWEQVITQENLEILDDGGVEWPHSSAWYLNDPTGYCIEVSLWHDETIRFAPQHA